MISDAERLRSVSPEEVQSYLHTSGWWENGTYGKATVWTHGSEEDGVDVLVPFHRELRDYSRRLTELLETVAESEERDPSLVLRDLLEPRTDVQHIHTEPGTPSGSTPIHEGFKAVKGVHDLFLAAATTASINSTSAVLPSNKPKPAWNFLRSVRLGQTMPGSYIFRVETPLTTQVADGLSSRSVLQQLHSSISAAHAAARQGLDSAISEVHGHIDRGVSANVCEALHDIGGGDSNPFTISFSWARAEPMRTSTPSVSFDGETIGVLRRLGEKLRELPAFQRAHLVGRVIELRRTSSRGGGTVTLDGTLTVDEHKSAERVSVELKAADYDRAVEAHRRSFALRVSGSLRTSGRQPVLQQVESTVLLVPKNDRPS